MLLIEFVVFNAEVAVTPTPAIEFIIVVEKLELLEMALASSAKVSKAAGAAPTRLFI
jgi:hypothetical protein